MEHGKGKMGERDPIMDEAYDKLAEHWRYPAFRGVQEQVIEYLLVQGKSALCLAPTGGGKSLTFQIPSLCLEGLTVIVSPLIALMKDQVDALRRLKVSAASMDSSLSLDEMGDVRRQIRDGSLKMLYVAPERLNNESFIAMMQDLVEKRPISLLAVDESHCISQWGHTFRPDYLKVARFAQEIGAQRVLALTATATDQVKADICQSFNIDPEKGVFSTPSYRQNLTIDIQPCTTDQEKYAKLVPFLKSRKTGAAIVYSTTQQNAQDVTDELNRQGIDAKCYHAGMNAPERKDVQDWFLSGSGVVSATIAFGMGIDKPDIRQVVHFMLPKSLENYTQEIGRAGRDGKKSVCLMLPAPSDMVILESFARSICPSLSSIRNWLTEVFQASPAPDGSLDFSSFQQSKDHDISPTTLKLLFTTLELDYGFLRTITPMYSSYTLKPTQGKPADWNRITKDSSPAAKAIRAHWKKGSIWHTVDDLWGITTAESIDRSEIVRQLTIWESNGWCELKAAGVRNRYAPLSDPPETSGEIDNLAEAIFQKMREREDMDVDRLRGVASFISNPQCFSHSIASYFGDNDAVPKRGCNHCSFCSSKKSVSFKVAEVQAVNPTKINAVLTVCGVRDDARFLARLAFGISSPRITTLSLSKNPIFGSCADADMELLVAEFEKACEKANCTNLSVLAPAVSKSTYSGKYNGSKGSFGGGSYGKGANSGGTKRSGEPLSKVSANKKYKK
ncbi:ATP-dependent DNA helicase [Meredithblackwellia eburnea MCA 4105]